MFTAIGLRPGAALDAAMSRLRLFQWAVPSESEWAAVRKTNNPRSIGGETRTVTGSPRVTVTVPFNGTLMFTALSLSLSECQWPRWGRPQADWSSIPLVLLGTDLSGHRCGDLTVMIRIGQANYV